MEGGQEETDGHWDVEILETVSGNCGMFDAGDIVEC